MPRAIIVGGPNGAGKTTFASAYLAIDRDVTEFVNADEISRELTAQELLSEAAHEHPCGAGYAGTHRRTIERVRRRVAAGGHAIPENVVRRRFGRSLRYLEDHYKPIVEEWQIWDSLEGDFRRVEAWDD